MTDLIFELEPFENEAHKGVRGVVGAYGDTMVYNIKPARPQGSNEILHAHLASEYLPEARLGGIGVSGQPSPYKASLEVGGAPARLTYNSYGLTRSSRALRIKYLERAYTYTCLKSLTRNAELRRPGMHVTVTTGKYVPKLGDRRHGTAEGDFDEVDLAVALVFEAVTIDPLDPVAAAVYASQRSNANSKEP
ncbi:hypothetical protein OG896_11455 [Streptomyces sp. NBC_00669]|uniref:hypothetical protein n=1 Tax=Streptomyces sp. NBC_00669 TaxID=2976011 RepID=UPI002E30DD27|nr:hypothetical protein [Streptomyces sp. NBC_00669]